MKVLFVSPVVPWAPDSGGRLRTFKLLKYLAPHAEVHLRAVAQPGLAPDAREQLERHCSSVRLFERGPSGPVRRLVRSKPERWFRSPDLERALAEEVSSGAYDLVHLDEPLLVRSLPAKVSMPVCVHHHKLDTVLHERLGGRASLRGGFEGFKLSRLEAEAAQRFRHHVLCSPDDASVLMGRFAHLECTVVPNGFDAEYLTPCLRAPQRARDRLLFLGTMSYGPNLDGLRWMLDEILPAIHARRPDVVLDVVGREPTPEVFARAGRHVRVHGAVEDVRPRVERAACFVAPLRIGGGTRIKLIEALALRAPVVTTHAAAEGLALEHRRHVLLADRPDEFARATLELLENPRLGADLGHAGRALALARYTWDGLALELAGAWRRILTSAPGRLSA